MPSPSNVATSPHPGLRFDKAGSRGIGSFRLAEGINQPSQMVQSRHGPLPSLRALRCAPVGSLRQSDASTGMSMVIADWVRCRTNVSRSRRRTRSSASAALSMAAGLPGRLVTPALFQRAPRSSMTDAPKSQAHDPKEADRARGCDDGARFEERVGKLVKHNPVRKSD